MKKRKFMIFGLLLLIVIIAVWGLIRCSRTNMSKVDNGSVCFEYEDKSILKDLSEKDLNTVKEIFNDKKLYKDNPSCGFSESISVKLSNDQQVFCIARDTCPIIYLKNEDKYFTISEDENTLLRNLLKKYGFVFPCL